MNTEQNAAAPPPSAGIQAIDNWIERTEEHRRDRVLDQANAQRTLERTMADIAELDQRTEELLEARRILQRAHEPTIGLQSRTREDTSDGRGIDGHRHDWRNGACTYPGCLEPHPDTAIRPLFPLDGDGYRREPVDAAIAEAWGLIANAGGGNWQATQGDAWIEAAERWRDRTLGRGEIYPPDAPEPPLTPEQIDRGDHA